MVEQQSGMFRDVSNDVGVIEEYTTVQAVAVSSVRMGADLYPELDPGIHLPRHRRYHGCCRRLMSQTSSSSLSHTHLRADTAQTGQSHHLQIVQVLSTNATSRTHTA
jgi:hypothetical protein